MTATRRALLCAALVLSMSACSVQDTIRWAWAREGATPAQQEEAVRVAFGPVPGCPNGESTGNPEAGRGTGYVGLFQMSVRYHSHRPGMHEPFIAANGAQAGAHLWAEQGWAPWTCKP